MIGVYILRCSDDTYYTGWTNNLGKRLQAHQRGQGARYTRGRRPVQLVYWEVATDRASAQRREYAVKRLQRTDKLALIDQFTAGPRQESWSQPAAPSNVPASADHPKPH